MDVKIQVTPEESKKLLDLLGNNGYYISDTSRNQPFLYIHSKHNFIGFGTKGTEEYFKRYKYKEVTINYFNKYFTPLYKVLNNG